MTTLKNRTFLLNIYIALLFLFRIALCFQGFDFCDEGWVLTFYKYIFSSPNSCKYQFIYYFSGIIGGMFEFFYKDGGILYFRIISILIEFIIFILIVNLFKNQIPKSIISLGFTVVILTQNFGVIGLHHNLISGLFAVGSIAFLTTGIFSRKDYQLLISGLLLTLFIFCRIPNILPASLIFILSCLAILNSTNSTKTKKMKITFFLVGLILGLVAIFIIIKYFQHDQIFIESIKDIIQKGKGKPNSSAHSFTSLIKVSIKSWISICKYFLIFSGIQYFIFLLDRRDIHHTFSALFKLIVRNCKFSFITRLHRYKIHRNCRNYFDDDESNWL